MIDWPSISPDLNPIENLWAILKQKVEKKGSICLMRKKKLNKKKFHEIIRKEWNDIDPDIFRNLAENMCNHINELISENGKKINY